VIFYSAGIQPTSGYVATITSIETSLSRRTLKATTHLESPHPQCATQALTRPYVLVRFSMPIPRPVYNQWYHNESYRFCIPPVCAGVTCPDGFVCEAVQEQCFLPTCLYTAQCVIGPDACSYIRCAPENICVVDYGIAHCINAATCSQVTCNTGYHCTVDNDGAALCIPN